MSYTPSAHLQSDVETLLRRASDLVKNAKSMPLSSSVMVGRDELLELLDAAAGRLPDELRQARWMLREREEFLAKVEREGNEIIEAARARVERMVERQEIVREARHTAQRLVENSRDEVRRMRLEAEDYCDQKLASFEIVLERTMRMVQAGREKLRASPLAAPEGALPGPAGAGGAADAFFDQDRP